MFGIFKKLKNKQMKKDEINQQLAEAIAVSQRLGSENKQLRQTNEDLNLVNTKLSEELRGAIDRVRYLAGQVDMLELQKQAKTQYSDSDRNY